MSAALSRSARALGAGIFTCCARSVTRSHARNVGIKGRDDFITRLSRDTCNIVVIARPLYFYIPPMSLLKRANSPYNGISWWLIERRERVPSSNKPCAHTHRPKENANLGSRAGTSFASRLVRVFRRNRCGFMAASSDKTFVTVIGSSVWPWLRGRRYDFLTIWSGWKEGAARRQRGTRGSARARLYRAFEDHRMSFPFRRRWQTDRRKLSFQ